MTSSLVNVMNRHLLQRMKAQGVSSKDPSFIKKIRKGPHAMLEAFLSPTREWLMAESYIGSGAVTPDTFLEHSTLEVYLEFQTHINEGYPIKRFGEGLTIIENVTGYWNTGLVPTSRQLGAYATKGGGKRFELWDEDLDDRELVALRGWIQQAMVMTPEIPQSVDRYAEEEDEYGRRPGRQPSATEVQLKLVAVLESGSFTQPFVWSPLALEEASLIPF